MAGRQVGAVAQVLRLLPRQPVAQRQRLLVPLQPVGRRPELTGDQLGGPARVAQSGQHHLKVLPARQGAELGLSLGPAVVAVAGRYGLPPRPPGQLPPPPPLPPPLPAPPRPPPAG